MIRAAYEGLCCRNFKKSFEVRSPTASPSPPPGTGDYRGVNRSERAQSPRRSGVNWLHLPLPPSRQGQTDRAPRPQQSTEAQRVGGRPDRPWGRQLPPPHDLRRTAATFMVESGGRGFRCRPEPYKARHCQGGSIVVIGTADNVISMCQRTS